MIKKFVTIFTTYVFIYIFTNIFTDIFSKRQNPEPFPNILSLTDCMSLSCHVLFQSESAFYSDLNVKELLARSRRKI